MHKDSALANVKTAATTYRRSKEQTKKHRDHLVDQIAAAQQCEVPRATQMEIAEAAGLSRQRVSQFLNEKKSQDD